MLKLRVKHLACYHLHSPLQWVIIVQIPYRVSFSAVKRPQRQLMMWENISRLLEASTLYILSPLTELCFFSIIIKYLSVRFLWSALQFSVDVNSNTLKPCKAAGLQTKIRARNPSHPSWKHPVWTRGQNMNRPIRMSYPRKKQEAVVSLCISGFDQNWSEKRTLRSSLCSWLALARV